MLERIKSIVLEASRLMVESGFTMVQKDGFANIVTSSDVAVQEFLRTEFLKLTPGCGFICEEEEHHDLDKEYVWIIDPIDGTSNYSRGIDHCCISVALMHNGTIVTGVVYSPWRKEMYTAEKGRGAFMNDMPIHVSDRSFENSMFCTALCTYRKEYAQICSDVTMDVYMQCNDTRRFGSAAIEICFLASGHCELYFEFRLQPWDYAAAILILEEAGGKACNLDGVLPRYNAPDLVCAANTPENLERLLEAVHRHVEVLPENYV